MTCGIYECFAGVSRIVIEETKTPRGRFQEGDLALLIDRKGRRYLLTLSTESTFHTHVGTLPHKEIIGQEQGGWVHTSRGQSLLAIKPTLGDYVLAMPRGSQVIYPKDLGNILMLADIFPGATVVEAGLGSGALTSALLRAVGETGRVITYEVRDDMVARAMRNISVLAPNPCSHTLKMGDIYEGFHEQDVDRIVLDVPEPWHVVPQAAEALTMGGIFLSFLPTILQVHRLAQALTSDSRFLANRDGGSAAKALERDPAQRAARPSHGSPYRVYHHRPKVCTQSRSYPGNYR